MSDQQQDNDGSTPMQGSPDAQEFLASSDLDLVRVLEDLVDLLVDKGVIRFTDLPGSAQAKLMNRKSARSNLGELANLMGDEDGVL